MFFLETRCSTIIACVFVYSSSMGVGGTQHKSPTHLTDLPPVKTLSPSTSTNASMMLSYNSPTTATGAYAGSLGWYSTTQCAASRYRSLLLPTPEYHLPVPANCHMNGTTDIIVSIVVIIKAINDFSKLIDKSNVFNR